MPSRITTIPPTVSPSPCHSANTFPNVRPERNCPQITDEDRRAVLGCYRNGFEVAQRMQIAEATNHVFRPANFKQPSHPLRSYWLELFR